LNYFTVSYGYGGMAILLKILYSRILSQREETKFLFQMQLFLLVNFQPLKSLCIKKNLMIDLQMPHPQPAPELHNIMQSFKIIELTAILYYGLDI
jgi:hypothetical protein